MRSASLFAVAVLAVILAASLFNPAAAQIGGIIEVRKVTTNGDTTTVFHFDGSGQGAIWGCDVVGGGSCPFGRLDPGTYIVVETVPPGWVLDSISCGVLTSIVGSISVLSYAPQIDGSSWTVDLAHHSVTVDIMDDDIVACTFTNSPAAPVVMPICVIRLGVEEPNGTVSWLPGYAYPGTPVSQCPNTFDGPYADVLGRMIVINQFNQTRIS